MPASDPEINKLGCSNVTYLAATPHVLRSSSEDCRVFCVCLLAALLRVGWSGGPLSVLVCCWCWKGLRLSCCLVVWGPTSTYRSTQYWFRSESDSLHSAQRLPGGQLSLMLPIFPCSSRQKQYTTSYPAHSPADKGSISWAAGVLTSISPHLLSLT